MHAEANTIDYREGFSLLNPRAEQDPDLPFRGRGTRGRAPVVGHSTRLRARRRSRGAVREPRDLLVDAADGGDARARASAPLPAFLRLEYERPRSPAMPPLLRATDRFLFYRKGPLALYALGEYIGKERVHEALRRLLEKHRRRTSASADHARSLSRAEGSHAGRVPLPAARSLRGQHVLGARGGAGHGGADRGRRRGR